MSDLEGKMSEGQKRKGRGMSDHGQICTLGKLLEVRLKNLILGARVMNSGLGTG